MRVSYRYIRPSPVLYARSIGAYAVSVPEAWRCMMQWLEARNARHMVRRGLGVFHDNPTVTAPEVLRYDACIGLVPGSALEADPDASIGWQTLAGGAYAVHAHSGPYEGTGALLSDMRRETVAKRGLSIDYGRPFVAIYLNDPMHTREMHRRTELCIPVIPIRMPLSNNDDSDEAGAVDRAARRYRA